MAKDGTILQTDGDKLAEHFQGVMNCEASIDVPFDDLPVITPSPSSPLSEEDLAAPLSEEENCYFPVTITKGSWPGWDLFGDAPFGWGCDSSLAEVHL